MIPSETSMIFHIIREFMSNKSPQTTETYLYSFDDEISRRNAELFVPRVIKL